MRRLLIGLGLGLLVAGLGWPWLARFPLGRLPGDIVIDRPGFKLYVPVTSMLVISLILSLLARLFRK
ncbi:MAG: DUF2905 domain-containing protein [Desulfobacteraceae bacterium]|nr:DUF2905 domain-containing protein [Desulfobacteraceae bacterium]